jgi:hypothetical protein
MGAVLEWSWTEGENVDGENVDVEMKMLGLPAHVLIALPSFLSSNFLRRRT